jgi:hypothetical protein
MSSEPSRSDTVPARESGDPALIYFSRFWRWIIGGSCAAVAVMRILWDAPVDALSVGLLGAAVLLVFARIKAIEWGGVSASFVDRELVKATGRVEAVEVPTESVKPTPAPAKSVPGPVVVQPGTAEVVAKGHAPEIHVHAAEQTLFYETARVTPAPMPPTNPTERVLWAIEQIRIELIVLAGTSGYLRQRLKWGGYRSQLVAKNLAQRGIIPEELVQLTSVVSDARNELVHGGLPPRSLARADTLALELVQKLREVKRQYVRVQDPDVALFREQGLATPYVGTRAVMLVTLDDQGHIVQTSVFPRVTEYTRGRFTSWEWDLGRVFREQAWYRDPATGKAKSPWSESATFIGREYPEEWGLEYRLPRPDAGTG